MTCRSRKRALSATPSMNEILGAIAPGREPSRSGCPDQCCETGRTTFFPSPNEPAACRRGAFIIVVMVCLLVAGMLLGSLLKLALLQARQLECEQARQQAAWLADSGLDRAVARLASDPAYPGESWNIEAAQLGGSDAALVEIRVQQDETRDSHRAVVVAATFSADGPHPARITRQTTINLSKEP